MLNAKSARNTSGEDSTSPSDTAHRTLQHSVTLICVLPFIYYYFLFGVFVFLLSYKIHRLFMMLMTFLDVGCVCYCAERGVGLVHKFNSS